MTKTANNTGWKIASILMALFVLAAGALLKANNDKIDTVKTDQGKTIVRIESKVDSNADTILQLMLAQGKVDVKLSVMSDKMDMILEALGVPKYMIPGVSSDTSNSQ